MCVCVCVCVCLGRMGGRLFLLTNVPRRLSVDSTVPPLSPRCSRVCVH